MTHSFRGLLVQFALRPQQRAETRRMAAWRTGLAGVGALCAGWLTFAHLVKLADRPGREIDELSYVVSAIHYTELVEKGDFSSMEWEGTELGGGGSINPHLMQWWFGLWLRLDPKTRDLHFGPEKERQLLFEQPWQLRSTDTAYQDAFHVARHAHAAVGALCIAVIYLMVYRVAGIAPAALAAILASTLSPFEDVLSRALGDGIYDLGLLAASWALAEISVSSGRLTGWLSLGAGMALGLAFNAKMTALAVGIPLVVAVAVCIAWRMRGTSPFANTLRRFALAPFVAVAVAWAANPYFWPTATPPPGGGKVSAILPAALGGDFPWPSTLEGHGPVALRLIEAHVRWQRQMKMQADYFTSLRTPAWLVLRRIFVTYNHHRYGFALALLAAACLAAAARGVWRVPLPVLVFCLSAAIHVAFLAALQSIDWNRYYLPAVLHVQLAIFAVLGCAAGALLERRGVKTNETG